MVIILMVIIRRYRQSKKVKALVDHMYDTLDSHDVRPSLPPRPSKLRRTDQLLCSVDTKQLRDSPIKGANTEQMEELCGPPIANSSNSPVFSVPSRQTSGYEQVQGYEKIQQYEQVQGYEKIQQYEQVQGYEKIQQYEQIQSYEKIQHCDVNLAQLVDENQIENVTNPTLAISERIADCCHEYEGHNLESSPTAYKKQEIDNITGNNLLRVPIALDSASVHCQDDSPMSVNFDENIEDLQKGNAGTCFKRSNSNLCGYERIEHCDLNLAHKLSPTIADSEDTVNIESWV